MVLVGVLLGQNLYKNASRTTTQYAEQLIGESLKKVANDLNIIEQTVSDAVRITQDMSTTQRYLIQENKMQFFTREDISQFVKHTLYSNPNLLGAYITWEQNAIDSDAMFAEQSVSHSTNKGQFAPYWTRSAQGTLDVRPASMESAYQGKAPNNRGVRPGDWYLCTAETKRSCVSDPAVWDVQGKPTLMTSITSPIMQDDRFIGLAGVDLSMAFIQSLTESVNENIFNGAGELQLISFHGYVIANTKEPNTVGKQLDDVNWASRKTHIQSGKESLDVGERSIELLLPVKFRDVQNPWAVFFNIPSSIALQQVQEMNQDLQQDYSTNILWQLVAGLLIGLTGFLMVFIVSKQIAYPVRRASQLVAELSQSEGDLTKRVRVKTDNEIGQMSGHLNSFLDKTHGIVSDACEKVTQMRRASSLSAELSEKTQSSVSLQESELEEVSAAVERTSRASSEVASSCVKTADASQEALEIIVQCEQDLASTVQNMRTLTENMEVSTELADSLEHATQDINKIVEVIQAISEQTNLLALNAAIESARAGEHGRGFSVVADEVRNLANRTKDSTLEIHKLIESLKENAEKVVETTRKGKDLCEESMNKAHSSQNQLKTVVKTTKQICDASQAISVSMEEQNRVTTELSKNISNINEAVHQVSEFARQNYQHNQELDKLANETEASLKQFKY